MTTTSTRLLELIARVPMMRTVQIADRLDMTIDEADELLRHGIQAGQIIEHEVDAPNNRKAMAYELSAQYMAASAPTVPQPAPAIERAQVRTAVANVVRTSRELTKVETAIAYVRENGPSSSVQLHAALGLAAGVHVSSYLGSAVRDGRMVRDGNTWSLPSSGTVAPGDIPKFSTIQSANPVQAASGQPGFRCALWSDGTFEIQRNGATIASLYPDEHSTVIETLQRARAA